MRKEKGENFYILEVLDSIKVDGMLEEEIKVPD